MAFKFSLGVAILLFLWPTARCDLIPDGVLHMECHDRYFMIAADLSFTGEEPSFDAVDGTGVYAITKEYGAKCGYSINLVLGYVELRASYFSCHTDNKDDKVFTFSFNLITNSKGEQFTYGLNKTCSPSLPWSPREVTCEVNYMEVLLGNELGCHSGVEKENDTALQPMHSPTTSDWQVMFQRAEEQMPPMNLSHARKQGYMFDMTEGRLIFRTPYGQPDSFRTEVNGVPVEMVHATLFSKQGWIVLMVDLVVACSLDSGSCGNGYMTWKTPEVLYPGSDSTQISMGLSGELVEQPVAEENGYIVDKQESTIYINIPYSAEGGYRKSFVAGDLYEFYLFPLYFAQVLMDDDNVKTALRFHRNLMTRLLHRPVFTENQTLLEERQFTVYLGDIPEDVELTAIQLNGQDCEVQYTNISTYNISKVFQPNNTHGYTLKVPFDDPLVVKKFLKEDSVLQYRLDINYTLTVEAQSEPYYHLVSIVADFTDVSPPAFDAVCLKSGISFRLVHKPFDYLWEIRIGSDLLTSELAAEHGYIMTNDSQSLQLEVPLFTYGYEYVDVALSGFFGTFEILVRDAETSEVQTSTVKMCPFTSSEIIMCSTDGWMTVVADVSLAVPNGGIPASTNLVDKYCGPKEADNTRALFSFPLSSCGTIVKLGKKNVTYQNEIFYKNYFNVKKLVSDNATERVIVQCTYPLSYLHRLFSKLKFESDAVGAGKIIHTMQPTADLKSPIIQPTVAPQPTPAKSPQTKPVKTLSPDHPPVHYIKFSKFYNLAKHLRKGAERSHVKMNVVQV